MSSVYHHGAKVEGFYGLSTLSLTRTKVIIVAMLMVPL